jgi:hypothetical protein
VSSPVSRAEFARIAGVSAPAITKASKGQLAPACVADRIDLDHPAAKDYLAMKGRSLASPDRLTTKGRKGSMSTPAEPTPTAKGRRKVDSRSTAARRDDGRSKDIPIEKTEEFEQYADLTLRECVDRFGTFRAMLDMANVLKKIEDTRGRRLANDETEGHLVSREAVRTHIVGAMHAAFERLLRDVPRTISQRLYPLAKSGATLEQGETLARELVGSTLQPALDQSVRMVRKLGK